MTERQEIIKLDSEILHLQQKRDLSEADKARLADLLDQRKKLLNEFQRKSRERNTNQHP